MNNFIPLLHCISQFNFWKEHPLIHGAGNRTQKYWGTVNLFGTYFLCTPFHLGLCTEVLFPINVIHYVKSQITTEVRPSTSKHVITFD